MAQQSSAQPQHPAVMCVCVCVCVCVYVCASRCELGSTRCILALTSLPPLTYKVVLCFCDGLESIADFTECTACNMHQQAARMPQNRGCRRPRLTKLDSLLLQNPDHVTMAWNEGFDIFQRETYASRNTVVDHESSPVQASWRIYLVLAQTLIHSIGPRRAF